MPTVLPPAGAQCQEMEVYAKSRQMMLGAGGCQVLREPIPKSKAHWRLLVNFQSGAGVLDEKQRCESSSRRAGDKRTDGFMFWKADFLVFLSSLEKTPSILGRQPWFTALASHVIAEIGHLVSPSPPLVIF